MSNTDFFNLFKTEKPLIGVIHLMPLPGSPRYEGDRKIIYEKALEEVRVFVKYGIDGFLIENFRDKPFYPGRIPAETIASLAAIGKNIVDEVQVPVGINALRNDAQSALAIATAIGASFIRVNIHMHTYTSGEGLIKGQSHKTLRLKQKLRSPVQIWADVGVKHAKPVEDISLENETKDITDRGMVDALIVTGERTGEGTKLEDLKTVKSNTTLPVLVGSGASPENLEMLYADADGFIVGSYFKENGKAENFIDGNRVNTFFEAFNKLKRK